MRGASWEDAVTAEVLAPLGMVRTTPRPAAPAAEGTAVHPWADVVLPEPEHHAGVMAAAGQLWATLDDLARFAAFLVGDTGDVLDSATLEEMTEPAGVDSSATGWSAYGLGLQVLRIDGRTLVGHGGSMPGFLAGVFVDREERTGGVSLANTTAGLDAVVFGLLADLRTAEPRIVEPWRPSPSPVSLDLLGVWFWGPAPYVLRACGGGTLHLGPLPGRTGRASRFAARDGGTWIGLDGYFAGRPCASPPTTWTWAPSSSPARPTTRRRRCPAGWTSAAGGRRGRCSGRRVEAGGVRGAGSSYCSISTTIASTGRCPSTTIRSSSPVAVVSRARPLIRSVPVRPGNRTISPTCESARTLR
ncbi:serine hydrolase domain-containing protein [Blastococcus brunescens]|uniref:Serine hydrolase domain-containing protein n=1 Tax=Blastococcus brunescens TaxID=1564165 RepID=A0ABZ1AXY4_9ACTN|nr:serine hydrolase domain-containing protein [Blastococcus sp. BMG 8361]WRL63427.1 serine hydrolase domain-containing protein [Blastococcus sp. BMG 8361]